MTAYAEPLKDPRWQRRRLEILDRADFTCQRCGCTSRTLHAHHKHYLKGRKPWEYEDDLLECLCELCHEDAHAELEALELRIARQPTEMLPALLDAVEAQIEWRQARPPDPRLAKVFDKLGAGLSGFNPTALIDAQNELQDLVDEVRDYQRGSCV